MTPTELTNLSDEELLRRVYLQRPTCSPLELELAVRLEHALNTQPDRTPRSALAPGHLAGARLARLEGGCSGSPD